MDAFAFARPPEEVALARAFVMRASSLAELGPQRSFAIARPLSPALARRGQTFACFLVWGHESETRFALCNAPPSHFVRPDPRVWTTRPPEGVYYQALSWLLWGAFMARVVPGSKKQTQTQIWAA